MGYFDAVKHTFFGLAHFVACQDVGKYFTQQTSVCFWLVVLFRLVVGLWVVFAFGRAIWIRFVFTARAAVGVGFCLIGRAAVRRWVGFSVWLAVRVWT